MSNKTLLANRRLEQGNFHLPSPAEVNAAETGKGGWKALQLAEWGVPWPPPKGWRARLREEWESGPSQKQCAYPQFCEWKLCDCPQIRLITNDGRSA